jgi:hypothetical protein
MVMCGNGGTYGRHIPPCCAQSPVWSVFFMFRCWVACLSDSHVEVLDVHLHLTGSFQQLWRWGFGY